MALEMVSPPQKFGQEAGEVRAFSSDGSRLLFKSKAALADTEGLLTFVGDNYVATRSATGWVVSPTSPPHEAEISMTGGGVGPYAFASSLESWAIVGCTQVQMMGGEAQIFTGDLAGGFVPLSPLWDPLDNSGSEFVFVHCTALEPRGTAADLSVTVFPATTPSAVYLPQDPPISGAGTPNSYVASRGDDGEPAIELLARNDDGEVFGGRCGSQLGGGGGMIQGSISPDGSRVYFTTRPGQAWNEETHEGPACSTSNPLRILKRTETPDGPEVEELIDAGPAEGDDLYQGASFDGTKVFFTTPRSLATSDQDASSTACGSTLGQSLGCDLYLFDSDLPEGERVIQVSAGGVGDTDPGKGANVLSSIPALSADGSHAYFVAQGVLTTDPNPEGDVAVSGQPNLYLFERNSAHPNGRTAFIGTLTAADEDDLWGSGSSLVGDAYPVPLKGEGDGHVLFFASQTSLTANDTDSGRRDLFRYESQAPTLLCISCASGGPDSAPFNAFSRSNNYTPSSNFAEQGRWADESGQTAAFTTDEPLVPDDEDGKTNPYIWREGQHVKLPGTAIAPLHAPTVSADGNQVGFSTTAPLLPQDGDAARDVYVVRVDGGFPISPPATVCDPLTEGSCQGPPSLAPDAPSAASSSFSGPGDPIPASCRKGQVRRGGKCLRPRKKARNRTKRQKRAGHERGGSK